MVINLSKRLRNEQTKITRMRLKDESWIRPRFNNRREIVTPKTILNDPRPIKSLVWPNDDSRSIGNVVSSGAAKKIKNRANRGILPDFAFLGRAERGGR